MSRPVGIWLGVLAVAAVVAVATTSGEMGVPPSSAGLLAMAGVVALAAAVGFLPEGPGRGRRLFGFAAVVALAGVGAAAAQDYYRPGITMGHDITYHAWGLWSLWRCVLDGDWYPRWNPYLALGIPLLQFYAPLAYLPAWPAQAMGASPTQALAFLMAAGQVATGWAVYGSLRWCGRSRAAGMLGGTAAILAPYHLMDQTFRLALGEHLAFVAIAPLTVAVWKVARGERGAAPWVLGVSAAVLLLTHVLSVISTAVVLIVPVLWRLRATEGRADTRGRSTRRLALVTAATIAATAAWWMPVVVEVNETATPKIAPGSGTISEYGLVPGEAVRRAAWTRYGIRRPISGDAPPAEGMPMYFGAGLLGLALLGTRRRKADGEIGLSSDDDAMGPSASWLAWTAIGTVVLATWPMAKILDVLPGVGFIQFPWRLLVPASVIAALAGATALDDAVANPRPRALVAAIALALLAWDASPYLGAAQRWGDMEGKGLVALSGEAVIELPVPLVEDEFLRVEFARMPPSSYASRVALARRAFPEYMTPKLWNAYGKNSKKPSKERSAGYHTSWRLRWRTDRAEFLDPEPYTAFREEGGDWHFDSKASWSRVPERITVSLPSGRPSGRVRIAEMAFPGWLASVDGGSWEDARSSSQLLAADVPAGAREVQFRYSAFRPWDRSLGFAVSLLTLLGLVVVRFRRRSDGGGAGASASGR